MTQDINSIYHDDPARLNSPEQQAPVEDIVSVNKKGTSDNKVAKGIFFLFVGAILIGVFTWFTQNWVTASKDKMKASAGPKTAEDTTQVFNPEKTGAAQPKPKLGAESGMAPPSQAESVNSAELGANRDSGIRAIRGNDGKVMVNAQGRAMGVDKDGNVVEVPAIAALTNDQPQGKMPLPGQAAGAAPAGQMQGQGANQQPPPKPPSRYGGSLFVGEPPKPSGSNTAFIDSPAPTSAGNAIAQAQAKQIAEIMRTAGVSMGPGAMGMAPPTPAPVATPFFGQPAGATLNSPPEQARPGTVGGSLYSSSTPVSYAKRMNDQNLILPKGRQADCILTGKIVDDVPGFTSCVLAQNLYSDNGQVLLLERGSELSGEYGVTNQLGSERLFVTWTRLRTPHGIEIDLSSPGADSLGTSGIPGHLDNRWAARIGTAFLLSFVKDVTVAIINNQAKAANAGGTSVNVQSAPGQNTVNASSALAEEVIKQTIKVRPRLTINEGDRISIYVARDLDFTPVYALRTAGTTGLTRLISK